MDENMEEAGAMDSESEAAPSQDVSQGYQIILTVKPDGFTVIGPSPLPQTETEDGEEVDLATALKHVIAITKENPLDGSESAHFDAGYAGE